MSDYGFGMAEMKCEGDHFFFDDMFVPTKTLKKDMFFVLARDGRPLIIHKGGEDMFVMHRNKDVADNYYRPKWKKLINKVFGGLLYE